MSAGSGQATDACKRAALGAVEVPLEVNICLEVDDPRRQVLHAVAQQTKQLQTWQLAKSPADVFQKVHVEVQVAKFRQLVEEVVADPRDLVVGQIK